MQQPAGAAADSTLNLHALEETVATTSQPAQATRCKGLREEQAERGYFAALERIERRPKYKEKSGEPDEFDEEQADVVAVATPQEARPLVTAHASKDGALQEVCIPSQTLTNPVARLSSSMVALVLHRTPPRWGATRHVCAKILTET